MLNRFFSLFSHDIGIDLGTANILVWVKGKGIVIREPSVVAIHKKTKKVLAVGTEAKKMLGKTPPSINVIRPLKGGVISDFDATAVMIAHYIQELHEQVGMFGMLSRPRVVIGIPTSVTEVERRAVWEAALSAGAREAFLIEEPMAGAIGSDMSVFAPTGSMVVDIGGGTTEIAVISLGGIVVNRSLKLAGDDMDRAIVHYIRLRHGLLIGERQGEELKLSIGSAYKKAAGRKSLVASKKGEEGKSESDEKVKDQDKEKYAIIRGRDIESGLPKSYKISETEIREALSPVITQIIDAVAEVIEDTPPELTSDILEHGILLTGGGSMLEGLDYLLVEKTHIPVIVSEDPLTTVVRGTGKVLDDQSLLNRVKVIGGLK